MLNNIAPNKIENVLGLKQLVQKNHLMSANLWTLTSQQGIVSQWE